MTPGAEKRGGERVREFVRESNRIEGILREPTDDEVSAHGVFMVPPKLLLPNVEGFVQEVANATLRDEPGMDVRVGNHFPMMGGDGVRHELTALLNAINGAHNTPYEAHVLYEQLHPFMDGNGRSGRAIWAWQMRRDGLDPFALPFLHRFYYQTLDAS